MPSWCIEGDWFRFFFMMMMIGTCGNLNIFVCTFFAVMLRPRKRSRVMFRGVFFMGPTIDNKIWLNLNVLNNYLLTFLQLLEIREDAAYRLMNLKHF
jgi:hypothetical protein